MRNAFRAAAIAFACAAVGAGATAQETGLVERVTVIRKFEIEELEGYDDFGATLAVLGDLDGDGTREIAVGAPGNDLGSIYSGAVFVISVDGNGALVRYNRIAYRSDGFDPDEEVQYFGEAVAAIGDLDGDGVSELAVNSGYDLFFEPVRNRRRSHGRSGWRRDSRRRRRGVW